MPYKKLHILHVIAYCEGDHAVYPEELNLKLSNIRGVISNTLNGLPKISQDKISNKQKDQLKIDAKITLKAIKNFGKDLSDDRISNPKILLLVIKDCILDAPHFVGNYSLCGKI